MGAGSGDDQQEQGEGTAGHRETER